MILEITDETIACVEAMGHTGVEIGKVMACANEDDRAGIAAQLALTTQNKSDETAADQEA